MSAVSGSSNPYIDLVGQATGGIDQKFKDYQTAIKSGDPQKMATAGLEFTLASNKASSVTKAVTKLFDMMKKIQDDIANNIK